jgi:tocopherol cyclase
MFYWKSILNPALYHGHIKKPPFFEGWYYKLVNADESQKYALIPGVFLGKDGYAFIQVLHGATGEVDFFNFPLEAFSAAEDEFIVRIGRNIFQLGTVHLDIDQQAKRVKGDLSFSNVAGWPVSLTSPGVMGWYAWVPKMECYHGVLSFSHKITGSLHVNGTSIDFTGGQGYIEKDWGTAFPEGYAWMQSNHFQRSNVCLTASIAMIPWLGSAFRGFIVGLWIDGGLHRFATYTGAKTDLLEIEDNQVIWHIIDRNHRLEINAIRGKTGDLKGPTRQDMGLRVAESLLAEIKVRLLDRDGRVLFDDVGRHAGLEVAGDIKKLLSSQG